MGNSLLQYCLLATAFATVLYQIVYRRSGTYKLSNVPSVGPSGMLTSYWGAVSTLLDFNKSIKAGYDKHGNMFKVALLDRWMVMISGKELLQEYGRAKEAELSFGDATAKFHQGQFVQGMKSHGWDAGHDFHVETIRKPLTRNIAEKFVEVKEEIKAGFEDMVQTYSKPEDDGWAAVPAVHAMADLIGRVSNRYFFNDDLCHNKEFVDTNVNFTIQAFIANTLINLFPAFLHPLVGPYLSPWNKTMKILKKYIKPLMDERLENEKKYGVRDYPDRPNDLVSWLMDAAPADLRNLETITARVIGIEMGAIHTSSNTLAHALFDLVSRPEYLSVLRQEVEEVTLERGWTKDAIDHMYKLDSFLKESQRVNELASLIMSRTVTKPEGMTFSNGVYLPYGTMISVPQRVIHDDPENYPDGEFNGYRWLNEDGSSRESTVATNVACLNFGTGRRSCPGRFFAAVEVKAMLAHVITTYDIKFEGDSTVRPLNEYFGHVSSPNEKAKLLMRKRV